MSSSQARVEEVFMEAARLFAAKNANYGDSWRDQGWRGNISRVMEKAKRIKTMLWHGGNVLLNGSKEHPRETLLDIINTCAFAIINMDDGVEWGTEPHAHLVQAPDDLDKRRDAYALSIGKHPQAMYAEEWPEDLRKPTDQRMPSDALVAPHMGEETIITPHLGDVRVPGGEKPSPQRRSAQVTDRGSGPRRHPVEDNQQA